MPLQLDHTIVPAYDKVKSAEFIARMFGLKYEGPWGHFAPVKVNDILTLDLDDSDNPRSNHYAFLASDEEFDAILQRIKDEGVAFGSGPRSRTDGEQSPAPGALVLLRVRERSRLGRYNPHLHHRLTGVAVCLHRCFRRSGGASEIQGLFGGWKVSRLITGWPFVRSRPVPLDHLTSTPPCRNLHAAFYSGICFNSAR